MVTIWAKSVRVNDPFNISLNRNIARVLVDIGIRDGFVENVNIEVEIHLQIIDDKNLPCCCFLRFSIHGHIARDFS